MKKLGRIFTVAALLFILVACGQTASVDVTAEDDKEIIEGGVLTIAYPSEPDTLDWTSTGATPTRDIAWHIFEPLIALDQDYQVKPEIAESITTSEDEKTYTIKIRENLQFHDNTIVKPEDVIASIDRWRKVSSVGKESDKYIDSVVIIDDATIEIHLNEVYTAFLSDLAAPKNTLIILPKSIVEAAGEQPLTPDQLVGTGPYRFDSWNRGSEIILKKFDDYTSHESEAVGGLAGEKTAILDELKFQIVKDPQVAINGIKTGIYDYALGIPNDLYPVVEADPSIDSVSYINGYSTIISDKSEAPFDDINVRRALNLALNKEEIAEATYGSQDFYALDGALFDPQQTKLYSEIGTDPYFSYDVEEARKLLEDSSYDGKPIKIMYSNNTENYKRISQITKQQLEDIGFKVELVPLEWATYLENWGDPQNWDLVVVGWSTRFSPNELGMLVNDISSSGWYNSEKWQALIQEWALTSDENERSEILGEMNETVWTELPFVKVANETRLDIKSEKVHLSETWVGPRFWNSWKEK